MTYEILKTLCPEILLITAAVAIYLGGEFAGAGVRWSRWAGAALVLAAGFLAWQCGRPLAAGPLMIDDMATFGRWFALVAGGLLAITTLRPTAKAEGAEYAGSLLLAVAGVMLVAGASDLVLLFVGLELISIPTYVLLYVGRVNVASQEAAVKYFFLSILASAIFLYGLSFLYGCSGSTDLSIIRAKLSDPVMPVGFERFARLAAVLILAGLGVKVASVPFHFYAPDVYQGTTHANAAVLSVVPKVAGVIAIIRLLVATLPSSDPSVWRIVLILAAFSMTLGNLMALWQDNLRRLLAYSSIANTGYIFMGLAVGFFAPAAAPAWNGMAAALFYLGVYAAATMGVFAALTYLGTDDQPVESVDELAGLGRTCPSTAALLTALLLSLTGIPPLAGFWGKFLVFGGCLNADTGPQATGLAYPWFVGLAILGALNAAVAAAYYLRIVGVMYFRAPLATPRAQGGRGALVAAAGCVALVLVLGLDPRPLSQSAEHAAAAVAGQGGAVGQVAKGIGK